MPTEEQMTVTERRKYLKLMKARYQGASRGEQGNLLDVDGAGNRTAPQKLAEALAWENPGAQKKEAVGFGNILS